MYLRFRFPSGMLHIVHRTQWAKEYATLYEYSTLKVKKSSVIFIVRVRFTKSYSRILLFRADCFALHRAQVFPQKTWGILPERQRGFRNNKIRRKTVVY